MGVGRSKLGILGEKGKEPESFCAELMIVRLRAPNVQPLLATGACTLKRTIPVSAPCDFRSGLSGTNPSFVKHFFQIVKLLFMLLNLLEHLIDGIELDFVILNLTFENCPRTSIFPKLVFLKEME